MGTLRRGYAVIRHHDSATIVRSVSQVASADDLDIQVADGTFEARVT
jgi:exonuclease VII large subunit